MSNPPALRYSRTHEWVKLDGDVATVGITQFAVEQLGEPTFLDLPAIGKAVQAGKPLGVIESSKATEDINSPVTGTVTERNESLIDDKAAKRTGDPQPVNDDPFGAGWLVKVKLAPGTSLDHLMTAEEYDSQLASEGH